MKALIVAAGMGSRLREIAPCKPLAPVWGKPLIQSVMESAAQAGISDFVVVTGYEAAPLEAFLERYARRAGLGLELVRNPEWTRANGLSVVAAEAAVGERFVLLMADHLFEPALLSDLLAEGRPDRVTLAVDRRLDNPLVDLSDVTRVLTDGAGAITAIGKGVETYDAFDTGVFLASGALIAAIRADAEAGGEGSITAGMRRLAEETAVFAHDIGERFWLDVDDPAAYREAEKLRA